MWQTSLRELAARIDRIIAESSYPDAIEPACLAAAVRSYPEAGGKRLRPVILLWSIGAVGGDPERGLYAAAALEVLHNWTLVHDDIIDEDEVRRGLPTAHIQLQSAAAGVPAARRAKFGADMAILAGDLMQGWVFDLLDRGDLDCALQARLRAEYRRRGYLELISGEALDVEFSYRDPAAIAEAELGRMQRGKTGALLRLAAEAGGAIGLSDASWSHESIAALGEFGEALALAFQLRDDELGIFGEAAKFGKPIGSDLSESKATLLLIHALQHGDEAVKRRLRALLGREGYTAAELAEVRLLLTDCGAVDRVRGEIRRLTDRALAALRRLPASCWREWLDALARDLVAREV